MRVPVVTLTTDFGLSDHYAGVMKGVILGTCPAAQIVDITHLVTPFAIAEGAYTIAQTYAYFPPATIHVVVVDPGVGTERRPILVQAAGQYFIGPDNGVLSMVCGRETYAARVISNREYFRQPVSRTFHGRDIFAPAAAHLAAGVPAAKLGELAGDIVRPDFEKPRRTGEGAWTGCVLAVDRFGNIITNFHIGDFPDLERQKFALSMGGRRIEALAENYAQCAPGEAFAIFGSAGYLEVSAAQDSAAKLLGCGAGAPVELRIR